MNDHPGPTTRPSVWELLDDPAFQAMLNRFARECVTWEDFLAQPMPAGMSPVDTWEALRRISQHMGIDLPIPDLRGQEHWYLRTHALSDVIGVVTRACSTGSRLHRTMTSVSGQHFLINVRIEELIAATRLDGLAISAQDTDILLRLDRLPHTATERLVANTFAAIDRLPDLADEPFSRDLFRELRDLLLDGIDLEELPMKTPAPLGTGLFEWPDDMVERFADRQMDYFAAYANHETGDEHDHHVLRALILTDAFRFYRPLMQLSNQVGRLVAHLYALRHDLPVLGFLPASRVKLDWDEGRIVPPQVSFDRPTFEVIRRRTPGDLTSLQTLAGELMLIALGDVERYVDEYEARDERLRETLKKDRLLNDRQRGIVGRALRKPETEFTIRYHKNNHGIAYPTARRDFLELVDKGYLDLHQRGKAFVFTASSRLPQVFAVKHGPGPDSDAGADPRPEST